MPIRDSVPSKQSNRTISQNFYNILNPHQKLHLEQSLFTLNIFDNHGNQCQTASLALNNRWDAHNNLQTTRFKTTKGYDAAEYSVYTTLGKRTRKVTEIRDAEGKFIQIQESLYLGQVEYRSTWKGEDLIYDGNVVRNTFGAPVPAHMQYKSLRITEGHRQIAQKEVFITNNNSSSLQFYLDNNIDSCQAQLDNLGKLMSYRANYPYGETSVSFGETQTQKYQYSGQELDESGLYYYGYRSYLKTHFRWLNPDPSGMQESGLNRYVMLKNNPVSSRDLMGLMIFKHLNQYFWKKVREKIWKSGLNETLEPKITDIIAGFIIGKGELEEREQELFVGKRKEENYKTSRIEYYVDDILVFTLFRLKPVDNRKRKNVLIVDANGFYIPKFSNSKTSIFNKIPLVFFRPHKSALHNQVDFSSAYQHNEILKQSYNYMLEKFQLSRKKINKLLFDNARELKKINSPDAITNVSIFMIGENVNLNLDDIIIVANKYNFDFVECRFCRGGEGLLEINEPEYLGRKVFDHPSYINYKEKNEDISKQNNTNTASENLSDIDIDNLPEFSD